MLTTRRVLAGFLAVGTWILAGVCARAQDPYCNSSGFPGATHSVELVTVAVSTRMTSLPAFSGTVKTTVEQKLMDGNAIHQVTHRKEARDSSGRTMVEEVRGCTMGSDGQMREIKRYNVDDPVARTRTSWDDVGIDDLWPKVADVLHQPEMKPRAQQPPPTPEQLAQRQKMMEASHAWMQKLQKLTRTEHLGVRDFNGVAAEGTRTIRTIPAAMTSRWRC